MQLPFIHPHAYSIIILMFTIATATIFILLLLLLFCYCYYYKTIATDKLLRASLFPGAAELSTHLLRLINILWLPLCQINKFGFYFPRRLLRSPILVGHHSLHRSCRNIKIYMTLRSITSASSSTLVRVCTPHVRSTRICHQISVNRYGITNI
jgi:hypothetical protein